jgi:hypothetical protein
MPAVLAAAGLSLASIASNSILMLTTLAAGAIGLGAVLAPFYMLAPLFLSGPAMAGGFAFVSCIGGLIGGFAGQYVIGELREWSGGYALVLAAMAVALLVTAIIVLALDRAIVPRAAVNSAPAE